MPRPFAAGLDYFVFELLVLGPVYIPLEHLFPLHAQCVFRPGWQNDLKHFLSAMRTFSGCRSPA